MRDLQHGPRKTTPAAVAVIYADRCTGCAACIEICPVDCIEKVSQYADVPGLQSFCEIDWDRCIGCQLCLRLPRAEGDRYRLTVCPWEAIEMVPLSGLLAVADQLGGPPDYARAQQPRRMAAARRQGDLARGG